MSLIFIDLPVLNISLIQISAMIKKDLANLITSPIFLPTNSSITVFSSSIGQIYIFMYHI